MGLYILRRLLQSIIIVLGVSFISFGLLFLRGDPAGLMLSEHATQEEIVALRQRMGFDQPWPIQYVRYMSRVVQGDFGVSLFHRTDSLPLVLERMPATLELAFSSLFLSLAIAIPLGIFAAVYHNSVWDKLSVIIAMLGQATPSFFLGVMLILLVGVKWKLLPVSGRGGWEHLVLPTITLSMLPMAQYVRIVRSSMLEELGQDYVRTATAKGLSHRRVLWRHAFRNALLPLVTLVGLQMSFLLGGAIIVETIFAWPGVGRLVFQAIGVKDFPLVQAAVMILAMLTVLVNLLVDLTYAVLDPRIRISSL